MHSHTVHKTYFSLYQASSAVLGWPGGTLSCNSRDGNDHPLNSHSDTIVEATVKTDALPKIFSFVTSGNDSWLSSVARLALLIYIPAVRFTCGFCAN